MCCKIYVHYWGNCEYKGTKSCKTYKVKKNTYGILILLQQKQYLQNE